MNGQNRSRQQNQNNRNRNPQPSYFEVHFNSGWIENGADDDMIIYCDKLGKELKKKNVSSSQLRNIYGEVMRIMQKGYEKTKQDFILLKPKIAYNAARARNNFFKNIFVEKVFNKAHGLVDNEKKFKNFQRFFEAILAYYKYYGGK